MAIDDEKIERDERAERLKLARKQAGYSGASAVVAMMPSIKVDAYKGHESGRNGFGVADARRYADLFGVSLSWLYLGIGRPDDFDLPRATPQLRSTFLRLARALPGVQEKVISYSEFELSQSETARETATSPM